MDLKSAAIWFLLHLVSLNQFDFCGNFQLFFSINDTELWEIIGSAVKSPTLKIVVFPSGEYDNVGVILNALQPITNWSHSFKFLNLLLHQSKWQGLKFIFRQHKKAEERALFSRDAISLWSHIWCCMYKRHVVKEKKSTKRGFCTPWTTGLASAYYFVYQFFPLRFF